MKNANFPILIVILMLIASVAYFTHNSAEKPELAALRLDMEDSLQLLWGPYDQHVKLDAAGVRVTAQAMVLMPEHLRPRQQRWNYPFLRFVASRHTGLRLERLEVVDGTSHRPLLEGPIPDEEELFCQLHTRRLTSSLEAILGPGKSLVLVDADTGKASLEQIRYGAPELLARRAYAPHQDLHPRILRMDVCVVVNRQIPETTWQAFKKQAATDHCEMRLVTLEPYEKEP